MEKLDLFDKKIMYELDLNARISASQLARKLKKSKETVNFRLNRLMEKGVIKGFYTIFNSSKLGWYYTKFYINFTDLTPEKEEEIYQFIQKQAYVAYLGSVGGVYDCVVLIMVKSYEDMVGFQDKLMSNYGNYIKEKNLVTFLKTTRFNQRLFYRGNEDTSWSYQRELENYQPDELERGILDLISNNARMPLVQIAKELNVDQKVVKYRLKKLEKDNIILSYVTSPDFEKLGLNFFQVNISLKDSSLRKQAIGYFASTNKCLFAMELLGKYDMLAELHLNNADELENIMNEFRRKFVDQYNFYDILTMKKEYVVVWAPFSENKQTEW